MGMRARILHAAVCLLLPAIVIAQTTTQTTTAPSTQATTAPTTVPAVPLAEINEQIDSANKIIRAVEPDLVPEFLNPSYIDELTTLSQQLDGQQEEARLTLASQPTVESLRTISTAWQSAAKPLWEWRRDLTAKATKLDQDVLLLANLENQWAERVKQSQASHAPEDVIKRMTALLESIRRARSAAEKGRSQIVSLQNRASEQYARVVEILTDIKEAQDNIVSRLLEKDAAPIWSSHRPAPTTQSSAKSGQVSLASQVSALVAYSKRETDVYFLHACAALAVIAVLWWARRRVKAWVDQEPELAGSFRVFHYPIATGLLLTSLAGIWIYTQAPRLLWVILGVIMMAPAIFLLRKLVDRRFHLVLYGVSGFYIWDQVRSLAVSFPDVYRILFITEMSAGALFVMWIVRGKRLDVISTTLSRGLQVWLSLLMRLAGILLLAALAANLSGYVGLGKLLGSGTLISAYVGLVFFTAAEALDGVLMAVLRLWPLNLLKMVQHDRELVHRRFSTAMRWAIRLFWLWTTLDLFAVRGTVLTYGYQALNAALAIGPLRLSVWNVASFAFVIWASFALSKLVRFVLEEDVYPRMMLPRGLPHAFSMVFHYVVLLIGFFTAVGTLGYDLTKFTILAGAFGVGLGFGLQNIVNNFVSGIILLFERPIKLGDTIEIDGLTGTVRQIGIRASVIRTTTGAELIVPNSRFIAEKVTNWTFSTGQRAIRLSVNVDAQSDPKLVMDLMLKCARGVELLTSDPAPQATLAGFAPGAMTFDLQAWTKRYEDWTIARSELSIAVSAALRGAGVLFK